MHCLRFVLRNSEKFRTRRVILIGPGPAFSCSAVWMPGCHDAGRRGPMSRIVDYDAIADAFDRRYADQEYRGIKSALVGFLGGRPGRALEVGCGTGHWLAVAARGAAFIAGTDPSRRMLARAARCIPAAALTCGQAEALPWRGGAFDRVFCINAFHHFSGKPEFLAEARRVLRPAGGLLIVGLDPHSGRDRWWIYEYFEPSLTLDQRRYPAAGAIRQALHTAGFVRVETREVEHLLGQVPAPVAFERGLVDRRRTSQLSILTEEEYGRGLARLRQDMEAHAARGQELVLSSDLRLYATIGWIDSEAPFTELLEARERSRP